MRFFKDIDVFQVPVSENLNFERHDYKKNTSNYKAAIGSYIGGIFSMSAMAFIVAYIIILLTQMMSGDVDQIKNTVVSNPIGKEGGRDDLTLEKYTFLPIIEIFENTPWIQQNHLDIWDGPITDRVFDLEKYFNYLTFVVIQRNREEGSDSSDDFVYSQNMRVCNKEDFTSRGYNPDAGMKEKMRKRYFLCFDVTGDGDEKYGLKGFYNDKTRYSFMINAHTCNP
jgi:hypothetical protein